MPDLRIGVGFLNRIFHLHHKILLVRSSRSIVGSFRTCKVELAHGPVSGALWGLPAGPVTRRNTDGLDLQQRPTAMVLGSSNLSTCGLMLVPDMRAVAERQILLRGAAAVRDLLSHLLDNRRFNQILV